MSCTKAALSGESWQLLPLASVQSSTCSAPSTVKGHRVRPWVKRALAASCADTEKQGKAVKSRAGSPFQTWFLILPLVGLAVPDLVLGEALDGGSPVASARSPEGVYLETERR